MLNRKRTVKYRYWTHEEISQLRKMIRDGMTGPEIARRLNRTTQAIHKKIADLGMERPHRQRSSKIVTMPFRVTASFQQRFRVFCRVRAANYGDTLETVMNAFMNQVEHDELSQKRGTYRHE